MLARSFAIHCSDAYSGGNLHWLRADRTGKSTSDYIRPDMVGGHSQHPAHDHSFPPKHLCAKAGANRASGLCIHGRSNRSAVCQGGSCDRGPPGCDKSAESHGFAIGAVPAYCPTDPHANGFPYSDTGSHTNALPNGYAGADGNSHPLANRDIAANRNGDAPADRYSRTDAHANTDGNASAHAHSRANRHACSLSLSYCRADAYEHTTRCSGVQRGTGGCEHGGGQRTAKD